MPRADDSHEISSQRSFPLLPLTNAVLFPEAVADLQVWIPQSLRTLERLRDDNDRLVACLQRAPQSVPMTLEDLHEVGVTARAIQRVRKPDNSLHVILQGLQRVRLKTLSTGPEGLEVTAEAWPLKAGSELEINALMGEVLTLIGTLCTLDGRYPRDLVNTLKLNMAGAERFLCIAMSHLQLPLSERQTILAAPELTRQLTLLLEALDREVQRLRLQDEIQIKVQEEVDKSQRDFLLRQQLKVINQELGDKDPAEDETSSLRRQLEALKLPPAAAREAFKELEHLARLPSTSSEWHVLRTYLGWILDLPWHKQTRDVLKLERARQILDENHMGQQRVKERILEHLAVLALRKDFRGPILCLVGPPGVGKTSFGQSIAKAMGRKFIRISVGGVHDEAEIRGHRRTYVGAMPGRIIQAMKRVGVMNPVILIDEIDKMGRDSRSDPTAALLEVLDPGQNTTFVDNYLNVPYDLSRVMFVTTANVLTDIPEALRDRLEVIRLTSYTLEEKQRIARSHLLARIEREHGLAEGTLQITDQALEALIQGYTREAGLRECERVLASVCRKAAVALTTGQRAPIRVDEADLKQFLGARRYLPIGVERAPEVGIATGLAWTAVGGEILFIETTRMEGRGQFVITGQLGNVMKESVQIAFSYVRSRAKELEIDLKLFDHSDLHIHFPEASIPKDGPSAGITIATALTSLFTEKPVRHEVAMTGEISLRGKVLPVGGIKEKVLAAYRAGLSQVLLPAQNDKDLEEIPDEVRSRLSIHLVRDMEEVLHWAILHVIMPRLNTQGGLEGLNPLSGGRPPAGTGRPDESRARARGKLPELY